MVTAKGNSSKVDAGTLPVIRAGDAAA